MSMVDNELAAVRRGFERGVVTEEELAERLDDLERLVWGQVLEHLHRVPAAS